MKNGLVYTMFGLIACAMMCIVCTFWFGFRSGSLDIVGGDPSVTTHDDLLIDIVVFQFHTSVCTLIFKTNNVILRPQ